jgi:hypothetical protein
MSIVLQSNIKLIFVHVHFVKKPIFGQYFCSTSLKVTILTHPIKEMMAFIQQISSLLLSSMTFRINKQFGFRIPRRFKSFLGKKSGLFFLETYVV